MTIESVSHPEPLSAWDAKNPDQPYYLELVGETSPSVDTAYAQIVPAGASSGAPQSATAAPVYEYWWTIGHPGHPHHQGGFLERVLGPDNLWERLADPAARVYMYFPLGGGWRVNELVATVKYMSPVAHEQTFWGQGRAGLADDPTARSRRKHARVHGRGRGRCGRRRRGRVSQDPWRPGAAEA
jgi:hypothetical protein